MEGMERGGGGGGGGGGFFNGSGDDEDKTLLVCGLNLALDHKFPLHKILQIYNLFSRFIRE